MNVNFEYELPSGQTVLVEAEVSPVIPAISPSLDAPGEPAEGGDVDILSTRLVCLEDTEKSIEIDLDGLFFRGWRKEELWMAAHEKLIEEHLKRHPNATEEKASDATEVDMSNKLMSVIDDIEEYAFERAEEWAA